MKWIALFLSLAAALTASHAQAAGLNARDLAKGCGAWLDAEAARPLPQGLSEEEFLDRVSLAGICAGYLQGFRSGVSFGSYESEAKNAHMYCLPTDVTNPQIARIIVKFVDENPRFEHTEALPFMIAIMKINFPCQN